MNVKDLVASFYADIWSLGRISEVRVLGDTQALTAQLDANARGR
jgi:hypothetical protein